MNKEYLEGSSRAPAIRTATTRPYIAIIPAMTTGMMDFIISSGLITDMAAIPVPDFAVPYAAPRAKNKKQRYAINYTIENNRSVHCMFKLYYLQIQITNVANCKY